MAQMKLIYTTSKKLDSIEVVDGQIIYLSDESQICLDMRGKRITYRAIKVFETDEERLHTQMANRSFGFVLETNIFWSYRNNDWHQVTPANLEPVIYYPKEDELPSVGEENKLYYTDSGIYNWRESDHKYNLIANATRWTSM